MHICSSLGHSIACLVFRRTVRRLFDPPLLGIVVVLSLGQDALVVSMEQLLPAGSVQSMMAAWAVTSCGMALGVVYPARRWSPGHSFKPTPRPGAA